MMDIDAPDALVRYSDGQRIVGAYVLTTVDDPDAPQETKQVPVYVAVLGPYKAGLPYDFDQVRVFTWNRAKHRYETAYREHNIMGYLPVQIGTGRDPGGKSPNVAVGRGGAADVLAIRCWRRMLRRCNAGPDDGRGNSEGHDHQDLPAGGEYRAADH